MHSTAEGAMHILEVKEVCTASQVVRLNISSKIQTEHKEKMATQG